MATLTASVMASAATPELIQGFAISAVSPDGRFITSEANGTIIIRDMQTEEMWAYEGDYTLDYSTGHGNCWSRTGVMVGSTNYDGDAAYWVNGEWKNIESASKYTMAFTNAITADAKYICGDVTNLDNTLGYDGLMMVPVLWADLDGDMVYETETLLPHPDKDFFDRNPQYVNALSISADGQVIVGQVVDCSGSYHYPIMWTKNAEGEWEYSYPGIELFNPEKLDIPVYPEEPGPSPDPTDYMTEEQKAAYEAALNTYYESGYQEELWPNPASYMSEEQVAAYNAAVEVYNAKAEVWNTELPIYQEKFYQILDTSVQYVFNACSISPNGRYMTQAAEKPGETFWDPSLYYGVYFDLSDGSCKVMPTDKNVASISIFDDGRMLGTNYVGFGSTDPSQAYIYLPGNEDFILLYDYFKSVKPEYAAWMEQNMVHDIEAFDENWETVILKDVMATGTPYANDDLSLIGCNVMSLWEDDYEYNSAIFSGLGNSGLSDVTYSKASVALKSLGEGVIAVKGEAESVEVYDLAGRCVFSTSAPASTIETGLGSGVYVVKATGKDGKAIVLKAIF